MTWRWLPTYPTYDNRLYEVPAIMSENFQAIEAAFGVEHESLSAAASGAHSPGRVSVMYEDTTSEIDALSATASEGAMAYDTTLGIWKKYIGGAWVILTNIHSRSRAYKTLTSPITLGTTNAATGDWIRFDTEDYDELSEFYEGTQTGSIARSRASGTASLTANAAHGLSAGDDVTIEGFIGLGYSGTYIVVSAPTSNVFTYTNSGGDESYTADTSGIFRSGGLFTAKGSGDYLVTATVAICASAPTPVFAMTALASGDNHIGLSVYGAGTNYQAIDEYPTPNDGTDYVYSGLSGTNDVYQASGGPVPIGVSNPNLSITFRAVGSGCSCDTACYGEGCGCYNICYGYSCNVCYSACYGYSPCSCNMTLYNCSSYGCSCHSGCYSCYNHSPW